MNKNGKANIYAKNANILRVPKDQLIFTKEESLPAICFLKGGGIAGIATEYFEDEKSYLVDIDNKKIFTYTFFDEAKLPQEVGEAVYITEDGKITKEKGTNRKVGMFIEVKGDAVLFKLTG